MSNDQTEEENIRCRKVLLFEFYTSKICASAQPFEA